MALLLMSALDDRTHEAEHAILERAHHSLRAPTEKHAEDEQQTRAPETKDARNIGNAHTLQILQDDELRFIGRHGRNLGPRMQSESIDDAKPGPEQGEREDENDNPLEEFETQIEFGLKEVDESIPVDRSLVAERTNSAGALAKRIERSDDSGVPAS